MPIFDADSATVSLKTEFLDYEMSAENVETSAKEIGALALD